jgi:CHAD domain-containing protein
LLEYLGAQRQKHAKRLSGEIQRLRPELRDDLKRTSAILAKRMRNNGHAQSGSAEASATATAIALAAQLAAPQRLGKDNLHRYRLKVKELGYILQMAAGASSKFIDDLRAVKDGIGEWHDWEELASLSKNAVHHGNRCGLVLELRRIAQRKYEHALPLAKALRKKYLRNPGPLKKGASVDSTRIPSEPVWEAIAMLSK